MRVTVIDYGIGNIFSVQRAFEHCGAEVLVTSDPAAISSAERLVLPGVGAFADGMQGLRDRGLIDVIRDFSRSGRPLLGICLGMQMLLSTSEEFGEHVGLDVIPGKVAAIPPTRVDGRPHKVPFVGWAGLQAPRSTDEWTNSILSTTPTAAAVYLVHSFHAMPDSPEHVLATYDYDGHPVVAVVRMGSVYGCQFHPEKSGRVGLSILRQFVG